MQSQAALEGERKQVTVLFADIKGSTELSRDLDPEQARAILDPALRAMMEAVHRYEGTVNQVLGDGIMALFGVPLAHEDHAALKRLLLHESQVQPLCVVFEDLHWIDTETQAVLDSLLDSLPTAPPRPTASRQR